MEPTYVCQDCSKERTPEELDVISRYGRSVIVCRDGCVPAPEGVGMVGKKSSK